MNSLKIFAACMNEASLKCSFSTVVDYTVVKQRLHASAEWATLQLASLEVCRLHEDQEGCLCPTNAGLCTAVQIENLKKILTSAILAEMIRWPEFERFRRPDDHVTVQFVPFHKQ
jgi:hypothetical protein